MSSRKNLLLMTDSYKVSHWKQYPPGTEHIYSYLESRGGVFDKTVFFGLQYYLKEYLQNSVIFESDLHEASELYMEHFGRDMLNIAGWYEIIDNHHGRLPLSIHAVPEGTISPVGTPLMTVENTDSNVPWLTNWFETLLSQIWYSTTVATQSYYMKQTLLNALHDTGTPEDIAFKLHDFGFRGVSSTETASIGGAAHLTSFEGSDNITALTFAKEYYDSKCAAFSIPATEHSTITSWEREHELDAFRNVLEQYPTGLVACVSDSYDIYNACENLWGTELHDEVMARDGTLIVRPDCYDDATKLLTDDGWKFFKDLIPSVDKVAQVFDDGHYEFVEPINVVNEQYRGDMVYFKDYHGKVDLMVTPNHRVVYTQRGVLSTEHASDVKLYYGKDMVRSAASINNNVQLSPIERLQIAFQADGSYTTGGNKIRFSFSKQRKIDRLENILLECGIRYKIYTLSDGRYEFNIDYSAKKILKDFTWVDTSNLDCTWCVDFIEELSHWDATIRNNARYKFDTTNESVSEVVELVALSAGYGCLTSVYVDNRKDIFNNVYTSNIVKNNLSGGQSIKTSTVEYNGTIHCVSVPTGMLLVKRNRSILVSGNSGDPLEVVPKCLDILGDKFGYTVNDKGYKVLDQHVRMIQGDGINRDSIKDILDTIVSNGWSADNIAFGSGGALLQQLNRDTNMFAFKCSSATVNGVERDVYKSPIGSAIKVSKRGRFEGLPEVFRDGKILIEYTLEEIRDRVNSY